MIGRRVSRTRRFYAIDLLYRAGQNFAADRGSILAAAISYYLLFSIFPLLILIGTILSLAIRDVDFEAQVIDWIVEQFPASPDVRAQAEDIVGSDTSAGTGLLGLVSFLATLWTASGVFGALRQALNTAFSVPAARPYITARLYDVTSVLGVVLLATISAGLTAGLTLARSFARDQLDGVLINLLWGLVFFLLPMLISFASFTLMYSLIPNLRLRLRDIWVGALAAAIGLELCKTGFAIYVTTFGNFQRIYGALGSVVALLFFVYLVSNIVIFCAELISQLAGDRLTAQRARRATTGGATGERFADDIVR